MFGFLSKDFKFVNIGLTTDIHSHILPAVDDGVRDAQTASRVIEAMAEIGVRNMVLTPHVFPELYPSNGPAEIRSRFEAFKKDFCPSGVSLKIAGEHMVYQGIDFSSPDLLALPGGAVLIEMSYAFPSMNIRSAVFQLNSLGRRPVLAHPERYTYYSSSLKEVYALAGMDCHFQLNVLSLGGYYGRIAKEKAEKMLDEGLYTYLGTDIHSFAQIAQLKSLIVKKRHVKELERLISNNSDIYTTQSQP